MNLSSQKLLMAKYIQMTHALFASLLDGLVDKAGILEGRQGKFEPRSLRRGGGQHDFIHKTLYPRFSFPAAKWRGGWGAGKSKYTFIRYLLNELESEISNYGDMTLCETTLAMWCKTTPMMASGGVRCCA